MNRKETPIVTVFFALLVAVVLFGTANAEVYSGRATGVTVTKTTSGTTTTTVIADTGELPSIGGHIAITSAPAPGISTGVIFSATSGALRSSQSTSTVNELNMVVGGVRIAATRVTANTGCICCPGADVPSCTGSVAITSLRLTDAAGNQTNVTVTGQPNQVVNLPGGIGTLTINEQVTGIASISINALHINATANGTTSDIIVAHVESDLDCLATIPTASDVTISGRVTTATGTAISRATVTLTDAVGNSRTTTTNSLGTYKFDGVESGASYILQASARTYTFEPALVNPKEDVTVNLVAK